ncbi:MAG: type II secretion system protein GspG [Planctomycetota bacterium]|jgi:hypothetical protein
MADRREARRRLPRTGALLASLGAAVLVPTGFAAEEEPASAPAALRVVDEGGRTVALEIAARDFRRPEADGPTVRLVGVAHIGDRSFYRDLQRLLEHSDVVLYESVMPAGARGAHGENDAERAESTRTAMAYVAGMLEFHRVRHERYPESVDALTTFASDADARLGHGVASALVDAWGRPVAYESAVDGAAYRLRSLGADGRVGGEDADADLVVTHEDDVPALAAPAEDNLQAELAGALGLAFQLEAMDYQQEGWHCSDMTVDEVEAALVERGLDFDLVGDTLGGSSLPARLIKMLLRIIRVLDAFTDGAIADTAKVMLIEMIGDETVMKQGLDQFGEGFTEVIVDARNQVVIDDLNELLAEKPDLEHVSVLYGAAHMPDLAERLEDQLGFAPSEEQWLRAIEVDLTTSAVDRRQLHQMRLMMRQMMRQQFGGDRSN